MSTQAELLPGNIKKLKEKAIDMKGKTFIVPSMPKLDITPLLLTKRQAAKKRLLIASGVISAAGTTVIAVQNDVEQTVSATSALDGSPSPIKKNYDVAYAANAARMIGAKMTPEAAHFIIYGKFKRDANGQLIDNEIEDPDCVFTKLAMPDTHPTLGEIDKMVDDLVKALNMMGIRQAELIQDIAQFIISVPATVTAIASAAVILPPGSGIPTAFATFQAFMQNLMNLASRLGDFSEDIHFLNYLPLLIEAQKIDSIIGIVNIQINAIYTLLCAIDTLLNVIPSVASPPGLGGTPGDPVTVEVKAEPSKIRVGVAQDVKLTASATNGSWEYTYKWTGPDGVISTDKNVTILDGPYVTTTYTCIVTDKKDNTNSTSANVTVERTLIS
jgi:hypothetical protein